jgi:F-type H+-transporting ATPase subunit b
MTFNWWTLALQTVNFAVLVWLLHHFLYQPVLRMIDARKAAVQKQYDDARAAEDKAKASLAKIEAERAGMARERAALLKAATVEAGKATESAKAQAASEAQALIDATHKKLDTEREHALTELRKSALDLGADYARRLLTDLPAELRLGAWLDRIEAHLKGLKQSEIDSLIHKAKGASGLKVITASALPREMAAKWQSRLKAVLGDGIAITFTVDPDLIAGADLHFPTAILCFSWQSQLAAMRLDIGNGGS